MKKLVAATLLVLGIAAAVSSQYTIEEKQNEFAATFQTGNDNVRVFLEVANTTSEYRKGLMNREELSKNKGMIFIFEESRNRSFWMKNTKIPLDIIFLDEEGTIINIEQAHPQPNASKEELVDYESEEPARYVVELRRGFSERNGLEKGDNIIFGENLRKCCIKAGQS